ncbi:MAG: hypothetical protein K6C94_01690 [Candidatus Gastranaerophilales bacterium]|nr:hypothetical protein [Candidatus Gastranaerophilales bacterium]
MMKIEASSFKDYDAFVFFESGELFRKLSENYLPVYKKFTESGLYSRLLSENLIVGHEEITEDTIKPEKVFISYPWEWCFSQLKDAALATLKIQDIALDYGMSLKDANCYNIQFVENKPILIDTSSFEVYTEGEPWVAYKQFCENFMSPLCLMAYKDLNLNSLLLGNINGISLELTSKLLPFSARFNPNLFMHIYLHGKMQKQYSQAENQKQIAQNLKMSKFQQKALILNLIKTIENINLKKYKTEWDNYYTFTNYNEVSFGKKQEIIKNYCTELKPARVCDFGSNNGFFSRIFSDSGAEVFSFDIDKLAVEANYLRAKKENEKNIFPLVFDMVNPSPNLGWNNEERKTLLQRLESIDVSVALALIHHLRFTYNIPFYKMAEYFSRVSKYLIIEFVGKKDSKVQMMLSHRKDVFVDYDEEHFEKVFSEYYNISDKQKIDSAERTMYLMERKNAE